MFPSNQQWHTFVHGALHCCAHILGDLPEQVPEQAGQQRASQVQALVCIVIPVVLIPPAKGHLQQQPDHLHIYKPQDLIGFPGEFRSEYVEVSL